VKQRRLLKDVFSFPEVRLAMNSLYDYDVFLSFATKDQEAAMEICQTLTQGGLRVFWSTNTLKEVVGKSFVTAIQESLIRSQHFVLYWTPEARTSDWVEEEYQTFYSQCYMRDKTSRRLVIIPDGREPITSLPPFLRNLQVAGSHRELVALLGGIEPPHVPAQEEFQPKAPKVATFVIATFLWLTGLAAGLGGIHLANNLGFWALVIAGLLLALGSVLDSL
jgi:hypothetical protein